MIHYRTKTETVRFDDFFRDNDVTDVAESVKQLQYDVKVNTPYGYHRISKICITDEQLAIRLYFANNKTLECGWEHKLKVNGEWKLVKDINMDTDIIETETGVTTIKKINENKP